MPWGLRQIKVQRATLGASGSKTAPKRGLWSQWGKVGGGSFFISLVIEGAEETGVGGRLGQERMGDQ